MNSGEDISDSCFDNNMKSPFDLDVDDIRKPAHDFSKDTLTKMILEEMKVAVPIYKPLTCNLWDVANNTMLVDAKKSDLRVSEPKKLFAKKWELILSPLEIALICPLLEESIHKVSVMTKHCPTVKVNFDLVDVYERFKDDREGNVECLKHLEVFTQEEKFANDICRLQKVMRMTKDDLHYEQHDYLHMYNKVIKRKSVKLINMKRTNIKLYRRLNNLKDDIKHLHYLAESTRKNAPIISLYRQEIYDETAIKIATLVEYIQKYDKVRIEQNRLKMEYNLKNTLANTTSKLKEIEEERVSHESITAFCKKSLHDLEASIDYWEKRYIGDMEDIGLKIDMIDELIRENSSHLQRLLAEFNLRKYQIEKYENEKDDLFQRDTLERMMDGLVVGLQSWFRGTMVRWELGRYSPGYEKARLLEEKALAAGLKEEREAAELPYDDLEEEEEYEEEAAAAVVEKPKGRGTVEKTGEPAADVLKTDDAANVEKTETEKPDDGKPETSPPQND